MLGQQCRRWTSIKPGITGYLVYCCAALYIVYPALKEHHLLIILLFVNSIQNKVMALVLWRDGPRSGAPLWGHNGRRGTPPNLTI